MNYAMPVVTMNPNSQIRHRTLARGCTRPATACRAANEEAPRIVSAVRTVEPMLLVHQQRAETFRRIAVALRDGFRMLGRSFASFSGLGEEPTYGTGPSTSTAPTPVIARTATGATTTALPDSGSGTPFQHPRA